MYQIYFTNHFLKQLKPLVKKYRQLTDDIVKELESFKKDLADPLGHKLYKIRLKCSDLLKGKSKSFRLIIYLWEYKNVLVPVTIYFKGDTDNISQKEIEYHLTMTVDEIESK